MNILKMADKIVNDRSEEKDRKYGPFAEGMERAAKILSASTGKEFTTEDMFLALVALKLSRQSFNHKEDNLLDLVAYVGGLNNYIEEKEGESDKEKEEIKISPLIEDTNPGEATIFRFEPTYIQFFKELRKNKFIEFPKSDLKKRSRFHSKVCNIKKVWDIKLFCDKTLGVSGNYVVSGSQLARVDLILELWRKGYKTKEIKKELKGI